MSVSIEEIKRLWLDFSKADKELLNGRIAEDIEKYRKGYCKLRFTDKNGKPISNKKITVNQVKHDFRYGANIFMLDEFENDEVNKRYRDTFKKYFNSATVPFYWDGIEPEKNKTRYDKNSKKIYRRPPTDLCMEYCEENGINPKLHCLVYEAFVPDWVPKNDIGKMEELYEERFRQISERYSRRMFEFEVINETLLLPFVEKKSIIGKKDDVVEWAFKLAEKHFPNDKLVINDNVSTTLTNPGANPICNIAKYGTLAFYYLLAENSILKGCKIDTIGLQHHCMVGVDSTTQEEYDKSVKKGSDMFSPSNILKGLDTVEKLGKPIEITEITIPTFGETEEFENIQADLLEMLYTSLFSHKSVETVVYWNLPDNCAYSSSETWNENRCRGGLFHKDMTPKKSAERLYYLFNKKWHTDLELTTDENGYVEFKGFYGDYDIEIDGKKEKFGLHKNNSNFSEIKI